jgi:hypothetical protein
MIQILQGQCLYNISKYEMFFPCLNSDWQNLLTGGPKHKQTQVGAKIEVRKRVRLLIVGIYLAMEEEGERRTVFAKGRRPEQIERAA